MESFDKAFRGLNKKQLEAVKNIDGPVLVIAGPGTGKTQLISTRVGYILKATDTLPQNILCLTFSEAGATAMRDRLSGLIGQEAYEVNISTYHAFGNELLRRNPEYFDDFELNAIDELGVISLLQELVRKLPFGNSMKFMEEHTRDILNFISDSKRALLTPEDLIVAAESNIRFINQINKDTRSALQKLGTVSKKTAPLFASILLVLESYEDNPVDHGPIKPLQSFILDELRAAVDDFRQSSSTKTLTGWKNRWLAKDRGGNFIFGGLEGNHKIIDAASLYAKYQKILERRRLYDYDDMILRAIAAMEENPEFKFTLAEQYLYIMLDEFQDTNAAQFRMIELLTDHPVFENQPNILAVGDDDQAIYAFQGANYGNMLQFVQHYRNVKIIGLEENYRSHPDIIKVGQNIAAQIEDRFYKNFENVNKSLRAGKGFHQKVEISYRQFKSDAAQYVWVAKEIDRLCKKEKIPESEIAVLAPKHRFLTPLLAHLARLKIPIRYEKRENILDVPAIRQLEQMSRLTVALSENNNLSTDHLWPEVLSYDFWGLTTEKIWKISWKAREEGKQWIEVLLTDKETRNIALFFLRLKDLLSSSTLQQQIDGLIGVDDIAGALNLPINSPFYSYYFSPKAKSRDAVEFVSLLSNLSLLRTKLREWRADEDSPMNLKDFLGFVDAYRQAGLGIVDSSPYSEAENAVNIMTAYGSKGREFKAVFIISAQDSIWGSASRMQTSRISLPENLKYIRYQGASEDERLRLLFVATTRAKTHLYFTGYESTLAGKKLPRLKYLDTYDDNGTLISRALPTRYQTVIRDDGVALRAEALKDYWIERHSPPFKADLRKLLKPRLDKFQLSPSHLNQFTDIVNAGPEAFFINSILRFPTAPTPAAIYGNSIHEVIRWNLSKTAGARPPAEEDVIKRFEAVLKIQKLPLDLFEQLLARGKLSLGMWIKQAEIKPSENDKFEYNFKNEVVLEGNARLSGKIDWLKINQSNRTATVIDFKTGQAYHRWDPRVIKLHRFRQQLMMYKILVESSASYKGYKVNKGIIQFVEPDSDGKILSLELFYDEIEMQELKKLIGAVWSNILKLHWPDVSGYSPSIAGIRAFESDLIN